VTSPQEQLDTVCGTPHNVHMQPMNIEGGLGLPTKEKWGQRLRRLREEAGYTMEAAAAVIDKFVPTSHMTLARLEKLPGPPKLRRQRATAAMALVVYGIHPKSMKLSMDDVPAIDLTRLREELGEGPIRKSGCAYDHMWPEPTVGVA
jgi:transcriptional regulator with XRE-family HTH domain